MEKCIDYKNCLNKENRKNIFYVCIFSVKIICLYDISNK